ncbi:divergent polysaccharide deacetylase family protein [Pararhizobium sp. IMCC21322]|uniref:divergent polysaccharide deacetylase family protein n=1 Tax=Pararhizobium sp. IMCC21322 TaxID=3067903 RepID=UPI002740DA86|nr:divergent polysaccharide deacetylase family protein [Pararhizobium sp. IMCC21322]
MTSFSVPINESGQVSKENQSGSALPAIVGLSTISLCLIVVLILWISILDDPAGGRPHVSVEITNATAQLDLGTVGVANVRPSMTPDPEDLSIDPLLPGTKMRAIAASPGTITAAPDANIADSEEPIAASIHSNAHRLSVFPLDNMVARSEYGLIPKRSGDGMTPFSVYSRPQQFIPEGPKIALVIGGIGLSQSTTAQALVELPPTIALAFATYGENLERWKKLSRENGFELLIEAPMEPFNYPQNDPGPHTLLVDATPAENKSKLDWVLSRTSNYIGVIPSMGARFTADENALTAFASELNKIGLAFIDPSNSVRSIADQIVRRASTDQLGHLPFLKVDVVLDGDATRASIEQHLIQLEELSNTKGLAVGYAQLRPSTVATLTEWLQLLEQRGVTLIPLSAAINLSMPKL